MVKIQPKQRCGTCYVKYLLVELSLCGCKMSICDKCRNKVEHLFHGTVDEFYRNREKRLIINRRLSKLFDFKSVANFFSSTNIIIILDFLVKHSPHTIISRHDTGMVDDVQLVWWEVTNRPVDYYKHGLSKIFYGRTINEALIFALLYHLDQEACDVD